MGLFDFLKRKKKPAETAAESGAEEPVGFDSAALSGVEPPETRYTQEYQDFLASQEAAGKNGGPSEEDGGPSEENAEAEAPDGSDCGG